MERYTQLPPALRRRCSKQAVLALAIAVLTGMMIHTFSTWNYAIGFAGALYILYPVISIPRDFAKGKIKQEYLLCTKVQQLLSARNGAIHRATVKGTSIGYFQTLDTPTPENRKYSFVLAPEDRHNLCEDLVYYVYVHEDNPNEVIAWENLGTASEKTMA